MPAEADNKQDKQTNAAQARQVLDVFHEISTLLVSSTKISVHSRSLDLTISPQNTNLDRQTLSICISLIENGVNPEALAVSGQEPALSAAADSTPVRGQRAQERRRRSRAGDTVSYLVNRVGMS